MYLCMCACVCLSLSLSNWDHSMFFSHTLRRHFHQPSKTNYNEVVDCGRCAAKEIKQLLVLVSETSHAKRPDAKDRLHLKELWLCHTLPNQIQHRPFGKRQVQTRIHVFQFLCCHLMFHTFCFIFRNISSAFTGNPQILPQNLHWRKCIADEFGVIKRLRKLFYFPKSLSFHEDYIVVSGLIFFTKKTNMTI